MLKSALRLSHAHHVPKKQIENNHNYEGQKLVGAIIDKQSIEGSNFTHFVFADCGMRGIAFKSCRFIDCIFAGCYLKDAEFADCTFRGCHFEICTTTGIKISNTTIEHVDFFRCVLPFHEFVKNLGNKHASNDKMMLNCAAEAHRTGRWREAEQFLGQHLVEKRQFWKEMVFSKERFYQKYTKFQKLRALVRLIFSLIMKMIFGDRTSIIRFMGIGVFLIAVLGPLAAFSLDANSAIASIVPEYAWLSKIAFFLKHYASYFIASVNLLVGSNLKPSYAVTVSAPESYEIISRVLGVVYLAILGNLATKSIGNGPRW